MTPVPGMRELYGTVYEGVPEALAVPLALSTVDGPIAALALVVNSDVPRAEITDFVTRYRFATRDVIARAADSQARWSLENDGRVTFQFLCGDGASRIVFPSDPRIHQWLALARLGGGTVSLMVVPDLASADAPTLARTLGPRGGEYWHISVGQVPL
ncbi:hypothetical protein [Streptomyces tauricus]|uniref:hypothetical protein n=1 Tax=Streptomyces tauricus TaxID=68274 RepID=UPI0022437AAE|nr:hypothetical protein [Streptomyces tauricus]MCW8103368.1 hypothetical protein [Streptomyces tauricus]